MTSDDKKIFLELQEKTRKIISSYTEAKNKLAEKELQLVNLVEENKQLKEDKKNLTEKYNTLKTAKSLACNTDENHQAKLKINQMVREIDKCIALLNS